MRESPQPRNADVREQDGPAAYGKSKPLGLRITCWGFQQGIAAINRIEVERMAVQQADINKVRASVSGQLGNKVMIQLDRGRNRVDIQEGVIKGAYPSVFTILVDDDNEKNPPQLLSFSYTDVLTRDIRMKLC